MTIELSEDGGSGPRIKGWPDSGGIALITWRSRTGGTRQQETADEREAAELLRKIAADDNLSLVSAQFRRVGTGPDG